MHYVDRYYVSPHEPRIVTTIDHDAEVEPESVGLTQRKVDAIWDAIVACYQSGIHPSITICLRRHGEIVMHRAIGHTHGNEPARFNLDGPLREARPNSLYNLFSASKAVAAIALHHMDEKGLVHLDDPISVYLPEFMGSDKRYITLRQLLTHRAGVPKIPTGAADLDNLHVEGKIRELMAEAEVLWPAGRKVGYHALTGGFVIGEICREVAGMDLRAYWKKHFQKPMGMDTFNFGIEQKRAGDVAPNIYTGFPFPAFGEEISKRILGVTYRDAIHLSSDPRFLTAIVPSGNIVGTAEETSRFYEMLLNHGTWNGKQLLKPETVRRATLAQVHTEPDRLLGFPVRYSLGFMLGRSRFSMYQGDTAQVFGHLGMVNIIGYADPARDTSLGLMNNGKPGVTHHALSFWKILRTIAHQIPKVPESRRRFAEAA